MLIILPFFDKILYAEKYLSISTQGGSFLNIFPSHELLLNIE